MVFTPESKSLEVLDRCTDPVLFDVSRKSKIAAEVCQLNFSVVTRKKNVWYDSKCRCNLTDVSLGDKEGRYSAKNSKLCF